VAGQLHLDSEVGTDVNVAKAATRQEQSASTSVAAAAANRKFMFAWRKENTLRTSARREVLSPELNQTRCDVRPRRVLSNPAEQHRSKMAFPTAR
jgi:hypothetical protein